MKNNTIYLLILLMFSIALMQIIFAVQNLNEKTNFLIAKTSNVEEQIIIATSSARLP
jgi:hypothetical protein